MFFWWIYQVSPMNWILIFFLIFYLMNYLYSLLMSFEKETIYLKLIKKIYVK